MEKLYKKLQFRSLSYFKDKEMTILHREDGPAFIHANGMKVWYKDGEKHREDGPAEEWIDDQGDKHESYFLHGKRYLKIVKDSPLITINGEQFAEISDFEV
jgi:hypothetical protein